MHGHLEMWYYGSIQEAELMPSAGVQGIWGRRYRRQCLVSVLSNSAHTAGDTQEGTDLAFCYCHSA